jgi:hypothetical protein
VKQDGDTIIVGGQVVSFDGKKLILKPETKR